MDIAVPGDCGLVAVVVAAAAVAVEESARCQSDQRLQTGQKRG